MNLQDYIDAGTLDSLADEIIKSGRLIHTGDTSEPKVHTSGERMTVEASALRDGDYILATDRTVVGKGTRKIKYVTVATTATGDDLKDVRFELDAPVEILRSVPVQSEKDVRMLWLAAESIVRRAVKAYRTMCLEADEVADAVRTGTSIHWALESVAAATAVWQTVFGPILAVWLTGSVERSFIEVVALQADNLRNDLVSNRWRGSSTSGWSNEVDHTTQAAVCAFLSSFGDFSELRYALGEVLGDVDFAKRLAELRETGQ